jgi:hypothetical protein
MGHGACSKEQRAEGKEQRVSGIVSEVQNIGRWQKLPIKVKSIRTIYHIQQLTLLTLYPLHAPCSMLHAILASPKPPPLFPQH